MIKKKNFLACFMIISNIFQASDPNSLGFSIKILEERIFKEFKSTEAQNRARNDLLNNRQVTTALFTYYIRITNHFLDYLKKNCTNVSQRGINITIFIAKEFPEKLMTFPEYQPFKDFCLTRLTLQESKLKDAVIFHDLFDLESNPDRSLTLPSLTVEELSNKRHRCEERTAHTVTTTPTDHKTAPSIIVTVRNTINFLLSLIKTT